MTTPSQYSPRPLPTLTPQTETPRKSQWWLWVLLAVLLTCMLCGGWFIYRSMAITKTKIYDWEPVKRGELSITVAESGTVRYREQEVVKSEVEGKASIIFLINEGSTVKKGDLLVELDSSNLRDQLDQHKITLENAEAAVIRADENYKVAKSQGESNISEADLKYRLAVLDKEKYEQGEYRQTLDETKAKITICEAEAKRSRERFDWSQKLFDKKYLSRTELQADELAWQKAELDVVLAKGELELLEKYTRKRKMEELSNNVDQNKEALERAKLKSNADIVQADADRNAKRAERDRQVERKQKLVDMIAKCRITAPVPGIVVYATTGGGNAFGGGMRWSSSSEPLAPGQEVRERQELIYLPTASSMMAEVRIRESALEKVQVGMPAIVTVDAVPGKIYTGTVTKIALYPDQDSFFRNPDAKVFPVRIDLDGDASELRTSMSCRAEILVARFKDALFVPVQAITRVNGQAVAYVEDSKGQAVRTNVEIGLDNTINVQVLSGLMVDQRVAKNPPLSSSTGAGKEGQSLMINALNNGLVSSTTRPVNIPAEKPETNAEKPAVVLPKPPKNLRDMTAEERQKYIDSLTPEQRKQLEAMYQRMHQGKPGGGPGGMPGSPH